MTQIQSLLDRAAIWQVLQNYARGLDRLDTALTRSCYWDDCIEDHGHFVGTPDDFIPWANDVSRSFASSQHGLLNHTCDLQGDDAYTETYFQFTGIRATSPHFLSTGRYIDHFQKRGGEWRFKNRITIVEGKFDLPESAPIAGMPPAYTADEPSQARRDAGDVSYHRPPVPRSPKP